MLTIARNKKSKSLLRVRFLSFDSSILDLFVSSFVDLLKRQNVNFCGPVMLPIKTKRITLLRSVFVNKRSKEHFEMRIHRRIVDIKDDSVELFLLSGVRLPAEIEVQVERSAK